MNLFLLLMLFTYICPLKGSDSYPYAPATNPNVLKNPYINQDPYYYGPNVFEDLVREEEEAKAKAEKETESSTSTRQPNDQKTIESSWCALL